MQITPNDYKAYLKAEQPKLYKDLTENKTLEEYVDKKLAEAMDYYRETMAQLMQDNPATQEDFMERVRHNNMLATQANELTNAMMFHRD
ncbi:TnpV protein [uncultured Phascolarctobacterium sp.]|uniref:TnpV protein n=1 Tax=uncultured Phascolarctobacterium sp. TaxID=512296 RepID=UPI0034590F42